MKTKIESTGRRPSRQPLREGMSSIQDDICSVLYDSTWVYGKMNNVTRGQQMVFGPLAVSVFPNGNVVAFSLRAAAEAKRALSRTYGHVTAAPTSDRQVQVLSVTESRRRPLREEDGFANFIVYSRAEGEDWYEPQVVVQDEAQAKAQAQALRDAGVKDVVVVAAPTNLPNSSAPRLQDPTTQFTKVKEYIDPLAANVIATRFKFQGLRESRRPLGNAALLTEAERRAMGLRPRRTIRESVSPQVARKMVAAWLAELGLPYTRLKARTVGFSDLARGDGVFVTVLGWKPNPLAGELEQRAKAAGFFVDFETMQG
jgi:hypothetical protein